MYMKALLPKLSLVDVPCSKPLAGFSSCGSPVEDNLPKAGWMTELVRILRAVAPDRDSFSFSSTWAHSLLILSFTSPRFSLSRKLSEGAGVGVELRLGGADDGVIGWVDGWWVWWLEEERGDMIMGSSPLTENPGHWRPCWRCTFQGIRS